MAKKTLKFYADAFYNGKVVHSKGEVVDLENGNGYADRWIRRGIALPFEAPLELPKEKKQDKASDKGSKKVKEEVPESDIIDL
jgi:hypothetical protein